jgi:hypothetical protein
MMKRQIWARYGVDPRRVYEVWMGEEHPGSREVAIVEYSRLFPHDLTDGRFEFHEAKRVVKTKQVTLPLFD